MKRFLIAAAAASVAFVSSPGSAVPMTDKAQLEVSRDLLNRLPGMRETECFAKGKDTNKDVSYDCALVPGPTKDVRARIDAELLVARDGESLKRFKALSAWSPMKGEPDGTVGRHYAVTGTKYAATIVLYPIKTASGRAATKVYFALKTAS